jgi:hypothetical protein
MEYAENTPEEYAENTLPGGCTETRRPKAFYMSAKSPALKQSKNRRSEEGMETGQMNKNYQERGSIDMRTRLRSKVMLLF